LKLLPSAKVFQQAAPLLVPLVESGERDKHAIDALVREYVKPLLKKNIDTLVLGCTHYGHLLSYFRRAVGKQITVIAEERIIAPKLVTYLKRHPEIESSLKKGGGTLYFSTGARDDFKRMSTLFFGKPVSLKRAKLA
jgi:glutamate racemase